MNKKITDALERMDKILKPHREWQEQINKLLEPQLKFQAQMEKLLEPQRRLQEQMNKYLEPHRKLQEQMQRYLEPQRQIQEHMRKYLEPQKRLQEQMERYLEPQRLLQDQIIKYIQPLNNYLSDPLMSSVLISNEGLLSVSDEVFDVESVTESLENISGDYSSTEEFLDSFFQWFEKLGSAARVVVLYFVLPYFLAIFANLTTPIYEEWWSEYADMDHRAAKKEIILEANELYSPEYLKNYRFVYATTLHVRRFGNMSSEIIDELYLGKAVRVLEKSNRWSFIEYQDIDSGDIKQGWVFTRYLHKFNK